MFVAALSLAAALALTVAAVAAVAAGSKYTARDGSSGLGNQFVLIASFHRLDFLWDETHTREQYVDEGKFIVENCALAGIKVDLKGNIYVTVPRWRTGVPSTLNMLVPAPGSQQTGLTQGSSTVAAGAMVLKPYPSWDFNTNNLRNCQSMVIDSQNRMWALDVGRENFFDPDPATIVNRRARVLVIDLDTNELIPSMTYEFPDAVVPANNSFLNDIVLDEAHQFAYFTSTWADGLLIVYDYGNQRSWAFTGPSTQRDPNFDFIVNGYNYGRCASCIGASPVDGIAITDDSTTLYYSIVGGRHLWSIATAVLRNEATTQAEFDAAATYLGEKPGGSDGLLFNEGSLFYGDLNHAGFLEIPDIQQQVELQSEGTSPSTSSSPSASLSVINATTDSVLRASSVESLTWLDTFSPNPANRRIIYFTTNNLDRYFNQTLPFHDDAAPPNFHIWLFDTREDEGYSVVGLAIGIIFTLLVIGGMSYWCVQEYRRAKKADARYYHDIADEQAVYTHGPRSSTLHYQKLSNSSPSNNNA